MRAERRLVTRALLVAGAFALVAILGLRAYRDLSPWRDAAFALSVIGALGLHVHVLAGGEGAWRVARAVIGRAWRVALSYRFNIAIVLVQLVVFAALVVTLGKPIVALIFGPVGSALQGYETTNLVVFLMLGLAFFPVLWTAYEVSSRRIRAEQMTGVFEALVPTPAGVETLPFAYLISSLAASLAGAAGLLAVFSLLVPAGSLAVTQPLALLVFAAILAPAVVTMWGIGLVMGGLTTLFKAASPASSMLRALMIAFGGVYIPLVFLPPWGLLISRALPVSYAGEGVRGALAEGLFLVEMSRLVAVLVAFALLSSVGGMWVFRRLLARARRAGTLAGY